MKAKNTVREQKFSWAKWIIYAALLYPFVVSCTTTGPTRQPVASRTAAVSKPVSKVGSPKTAAAKKVIKSKAVARPAKAARRNFVHKKQNRLGRAHRIPRWVVAGE